MHLLFCSFLLWFLTNRYVEPVAFHSLYFASFRAPAVSMFNCWRLFTSMSWNTAVVLDGIVMLSAELGYLNIKLKNRLVLERSVREYENWTIQILCASHFHEWVLSTECYNLQNVIIYVYPQSCIRLSWQTEAIISARNFLDPETILICHPSVATHSTRAWALALTVAVWWAVSAILCDALLLYRRCCCLYQIIIASCN